MSIPGSRKSHLSLAMVVQDAGVLLVETLQSVNDIVDEVVILDTGSTDNTTQIVQDHNAVLIEHVWQDDFSEARNCCLSQVTGDWVLWLEAGERLSDAAAGALREFVDQKADATKAYMLTVKVPQVGTNIAGEQVSRIRLVPNLRSIRFTGRVRESLMESLAASDLDVEVLPIVIQRSERDHDPQVKIQKSRRNIWLAELEIKQSGPQPRLSVVIANALQDLGESQRAVEEYRVTIKNGPHGSTEVLEAYYGMLTALDGVNQLEEQIKVCLEALDAYPLDTQLLCALGGYLQTQGRWDLAGRAYESAHRHGKINPETWHLDDLRGIAAVCYSLVLQNQNQDDQALNVLEEAVATDPQSMRLRRHLLELHVKHARRDEAMAQLNYLQTSPGDDDRHRRIDTGSDDVQKSRNSVPVSIKIADHGSSYQD